MPKIIDALLVLLLTFLPLALGTVHLWSITIFAITSVILINLCVFHPDFSFKKIFKFPIVIGSVIFLAYLLFQLIPLPAPVLKMISPNTYKLYNDFSLTYPWFNSWRPLSIYPWLTVFELIKLISCGLIFVTILFRSGLKDKNQKINDVERNTLIYIQLGCLTGALAILLHSFVDFNLHITANAFYFTVLLGLAVTLSGNIEDINKEFIFKIVNSIVIIGFFIALFGIVQKLSGSEKIYWIIKKDGDHFGPYVNYDHYAGFIGICASIAIASLMAKVRFSSFFLYKDIKNKLMWLSSQEASKTIRQFAASGVMVGSLFYSSSRGGILSFILAIAIFSFFIIIYTRRNRRGRIILFFILMLLLSSVITFWIGPDSTFERFNELNNFARYIIHEPSILSEIRFEIWNNTVHIIKDFIVTGTGLGTFSSIFPKYRTYYWGDEWAFLRYAHSDYLQTMAETGMVGLIFILLLLYYFFTLYKLTIKRLK